MLTRQHDKDQIKEERFNLQDKIKKLEAEANQMENNLGFLGKSKKSNPILYEYLKKLDDVEQKLINLWTQLKAIPSVKQIYSILTPGKLLRLALQAAVLNFSIL